LGKEGDVKRGEMEEGCGRVREGKAKGTGKEAKGEGGRGVKISKQEAGRNEGTRVQRE